MGDKIVYGRTGAGLFMTDGCIHIYLLTVTGRAATGHWAGIYLEYIHYSTLVVSQQAKALNAGDLYVYD